MRVLIAEDDPISRQLLKVALRGTNYELTIVNDGIEALAVLAEPDCPRLIVMDWMMPKLNGLEVCRTIRERNQELYSYVILLTANGHQGQINEGFEAGADDYITKPFDPHELKARLRAGRRIIELQEQLVSAREQMRYDATHDFLTGFLNRATLIEIFNKEVARSERIKEPLAVIMADIDLFKSVNDSFGHLAGDEVLREVARRISASVRSYDSVGRYGGEEFIIVSPSCSLADATKLAERLRESICSERFEVCDRKFTVTLSLGVAGLDDMSQASHLLRLADEALYRAKGAGRNRVEVAKWKLNPAGILIAG